MDEQTREQEVSLEQSGYDGGVSLRAEIEKLTKIVVLMVDLQGDLLKKLQEQHTMLGSIAKFVKDNGTAMPSFGVGR